MTQVTLGGNPWTVVFSNRVKEKWGYTDWGKRRISISSDTRKRGNDREILIHELLHAILPTLDESAVDAAATELDDALDACGY